MNHIKSILFFVLFLSTTSVIAQRERNYIYLLDCTKSMTGYGSGNPDIWDKTKDYLENELNNQTSGTTLHVLPFQSNVLQGYHFLSEDLDWPKIEKDLDEIVQNISNTNICAAWDAIDKYIDKHKDNYILLLTDGHDNVNGMDAVASKLRNWCGKHPNTYAFYVQLTKAAVDNRVAEAINICENEFVVDASDATRNKGIPVFGSFDKGLIIYANTLNLSKTHKIGFSSAGEYNAKAVCNDPYFDVKVVDGTIKNGIVPIQIEARKEISEINSEIPEIYDFTFDVKGSNVDIINPTVRVRMTNKPERTLEMPSDEANMGKATWYDSFLFCGASEPEQLDLDLNTVFNGEAKKDGAIVEFSVTETDGAKGFRLLHNGKPIENGRITLSAKAGDKNILSIVYDKDAEEGTRYLTLKPVAKGNLDKINDQPVEEYTLSVRSKYCEKWNPLKTILMWTGIILGAVLLLWFIVLKHILYPTIKVTTIQINEPYFSKVKVKGARRVVFTNKIMHQSMINRLFTGRIEYKKNEVWTSPLAFEPGSKKRTLRVIRTKDYVFDPYTSVLKAPSDYTITNTNDNTIIKITIN